MIYVSFMNKNKQSNGVLLASYKRQPNNEQYNLVFDSEAKNVLEIKNDDMILSTLNLVAEWVNVSKIDFVNSPIGVITDYYGYPFIADNPQLFLNLSNSEYVTKFVIENLPEIE